MHGCVEAMELVREGVDLFLLERFCMFRTVAAVIGCLALLRFSLRFLSNACKWLRAYFLAPWGIGRTDLKRYGPWAAVTGASEGIGRGYALELARRGLNVVLMSRSQEKLDKVAGKIREKYSREVRVVPVDFSHGPEIYSQLAESVQDLDIGILVNNVGVTYEYPEYFLDAPIERLCKIVEVNIQATVHMTHLIMPKMVARRRGIVVNLSSASAIKHTVLLTVYVSTKTFFEFFSASLSLEYAHKGLIVQTVSPFIVATAMSGIYAGSRNWFIADAVQYTRSAVATIGIMDYTHGSLSHAVQGVFMRATPTFIATRSFLWVLKRIRDGVLKRKAKEKRT